ncbi:MULTISPECIES: YkgJ family cysteine cluster protein [unclassified Fusibacter]|uniref:YkgJ family cysteine cluster protein n=1 Tax=unclassified Fusibacter TaxID=2624464 RepID=UPI00101209A3|nr:MULTISPECIES: YkgJ family cysteine cluster protein [unclassified Fusibacter]MCK8059128.1 YkgJ family cysteine cluster protein [Fusibacter sp. A2]NPE22537.1 YkgJ family cysteine cluster protein [Fusibacter sp. A1]RXV60639.1 YkgJ family cysteine cluster protein [Fusibacter sp. A1]
MKSNVTLENISDGKIYELNDMVKADAQGCDGCSACCHGVGDFVVLNPFDVYTLRAHLNQTFDELLVDHLTLVEENKLTMPHLAMKGESERCSFLNEEDRCTVHAHRPDICRLFPLGRVYENDDFSFFLQVGACTKPKLAKVKVKKWIGIADYSKNKDFILEWYRLIKALRFRVKFIHTDEELREVNDYLLDMFYRIQVTEESDFYSVFYKQLPIAKERLGII